LLPRLVNASKGTPTASVPLLDRSSVSRRARVTQERRSATKRDEARRSV